MNAVHITRRLDESLGGWSKPFVGTDASGSRWVVKPDARPRDGPALFSELVMAGLAGAFGLNWPAAQVAELDPSLIQGVTRGVAIAWLPELRLAIPERPQRRQTEQPEVETCESIIAGARAAEEWIAQHVPPLLTAANLDQLAGFAVLSSWAGASDQKWDALQVDQAGGFLFLDGGHYLGTELGEPVKKIESARERGQAADRFAFLEVLHGQPLALFTPWLDRLAGLRSAFEVGASLAPVEWVGEQWRLHHLRAALFDQIPEFTDSFQSWVRWNLP